MGHNPEVTYMQKTLRRQLRDLIDQANQLDALVAGAKDLPDLEAARVLVEVNKLGERLGKAGAKLAAAANGKAK